MTPGGEPETASCGQGFTKLAHGAGTRRLGFKWVVSPWEGGARTVAG
jgi:hypothetical protein